MSAEVVDLAAARLVRQLQPVGLPWDAATGARVAAVLDRLAEPGAQEAVRPHLTRMSYMTDVEQLTLLEQVLPPTDDQRMAELARALELNDRFRRGDVLGTPEPLGAA
jgi:hypothetical protein